jgi:hypothetical protein
MMSLIVAEEIKRCGLLFGLENKGKPVKNSEKYFSQIGGTKKVAPFWALFRVFLVLSRRPLASIFIVEVSR